MTSRVLGFGAYLATSGMQLAGYIGQSQPCSGDRARWTWLREGNISARGWMVMNFNVLVLGILGVFFVIAIVLVVKAFDFLKD
jgi:hypothetical protein